MPRCLRSVGVFVIVVGNYFVAAFYEASGASTCNHGFQHPRRNQCAPDWMVPLQTRVGKTTFPPLRAEQLLNTHKKSARKGGLRADLRECPGERARIRERAVSNWTFLTGKKDEIVFNCLKVIS